MSQTSTQLVDAREALELAGMSHKAVFGRVIDGLAQDDPSLTVVVSDYGRRLSLDDFATAHPDGMIQCGIAEQNQVEVAAAMANEGFTTFVPSYATFITSRVADQVRVLLGSMSSPAMLVGVSCGVEAAHLGASHTSLEDLGTMRQIPNMCVLAPSDQASFAAALRELAAHPRPAYVRMNDGCKKNLHPQGVDAVIGRATVLHEPSEQPLVTILSCGTITLEALEAAKALQDADIPVRVIDVPSVKPLPQNIRELCAESRLVATVEEHAAIGGLGGAIAELFCDDGMGTPLLRLGMPDYYLAADYRENILEQAGIDAKGIASAIIARLARL